MPPVTMKKRRICTKTGCPSSLICLSGRFLLGMLSNSYSLQVL